MELGWGAGEWRGREMMRDRHATMLSLSVGDGELCGARGARVQRGGADGGDWMRGERVGVGGVHGVGGGERDGADGAEIRRRHVEEGRLQSVGQRAGHGYHHEMCPYPENHRPGLTPLEEVQTLARVLKESPRSIGAMGRFFICRSSSELVQLRQKSSVAPAG